jgi:hypothetical protein
MKQCWLLNLMRWWCLRTQSNLKIARESMDRRKMCRQSVLLKIPRSLSSAPSVWKFLATTRLPCTVWELPVNNTAFTELVLHHGLQNAREDIESPLAQIAVGQWKCIVRGWQHS